MKTYVGTRCLLPPVASVIMMEPGHSPACLSWSRSRDIFPRSRFAWGTRVWACRLLAWCLIRSATESEQCADENYHQFARDVIASLPRGGWSMTQLQIVRWIDDGIPVVVD